MPASLLHDMFPVVEAFDQEVVQAGVRPAQMVLVAFLVTFGVVRALVHLIRRGVGRNVVIGSLHVHHLVPGIFLLLITGFIAVAIDPDVPSGLWWVLPTMFGVGAALVLDEFALWLNLRDVYWSEEGRRSIDAVIIAAALFAIVALGLPFWLQVIADANPVGGVAIVAYHVLSVGSALVCLAKGKWITGVVGFVLWPVGLVGALRPARPGSRWAHRRQPEVPSPRSRR